MKWLFRCLYLITELKLFIMIAFTAFVIWSFVKWILAMMTKVFSLRDWLGSAGLLFGTFSWSLLIGFSFYYAVENKIPVHGSALIVFYTIGSCAAVSGMLLALTGRGWVRRSALIVSLSMVFQWLGMWNMGLGLDQIITIAIFLLLIAWGAISLAVRRVEQV